MLKHYFQPGREVFRSTIDNAMPQLLTSGRDKTLKHQMLDIIGAATPTTSMQSLVALKKLVETLAA